MLGPTMPGWVRSRWILAQALQWLDERNRGPAGRSARAVKVTAEIQGGLHRIRGVDLDDRRVKVMDHDWIYRQVFLYEEEGLRRFLRAGSTPDLVAGADLAAVIQVNQERAAGVGSEIDAEGVSFAHGAR